MRKFVCRLLAVLIFCSASVVATATAALDPTPIRVVIPDDYPPFYYRTKDGFDGLSIEVLAHINRRLGYRFQITQVSNMNALLSALANGKYDVAPNLTPSDVRKKQFLFTHIPHVYEDQVLIVRADSPLRQKPTLAELANYHVGVVAGWYYSQEFADNTAIERVYSIDSVNQLQALFSGAFDIALSNREFFEYLTRTQGVSRAVRLLEPPLQTEPIYMAVSRHRKGARRMVHAYDEELAHFVRTAEYQQLLQKYGLKSSSENEVKP